jgi:hypothetical protein
MTNKQKLAHIKKLEPLISHIKECAKVIIDNTFDRYIQTVIDIKVSDTHVEIFYDYCIYNEWGKESVKIPIEWFDEGFDYKLAYNDFYAIIKKGGTTYDSK